MIIGGRSVTTGEDTGTASAIARSAARVRTRTGSAMTIPISRGSGRVQRQRPRSGDQEGERSLCGVQRSGRGARGSRTDTRAPGTTPRLGRRTTRRHGAAPSRTSGLRRCHAATRRVRRAGPARARGVPRMSFSCVPAVPPWLPAPPQAGRSRRAAADADTAGGQPQLGCPASLHAAWPGHSACLHTPGTRAMHARHAAGTRSAHAAWYCGRPRRVVSVGGLGRGPGTPGKQRGQYVGGRADTLDAVTLGSEGAAMTLASPVPMTRQPTTPAAAIHPHTRRRPRLSAPAARASL